MKKYTLEFKDEDTIQYRGMTISNEFIDDYKSYIVNSNGEVPQYIAGSLLDALQQVDQFIDGGHHFKLVYSNFAQVNKYNRKHIIRLDDAADYVGRCIDHIVLSDPTYNVHFDNIMWRKDTDTFILFSTITVGKNHPLYEYHQYRANTNKVLVVIVEKNSIVKAEYCDNIVYALDFSNNYLGVK